MRKNVGLAAALGVFVVLVQISGLVDARNVRPAPAAPLRRASTPDVAKTVEAEKTPEVDAASAAECTPSPSADADHFVIGYGSLIQSASKERTLRGTGESLPVQVQGYRREWNLKGDGLGPDTTYLGVVPDSQSSFNGVVFQLQLRGGNKSAVEALKQYDEREKFYCRRKVDLKNIKVLGGQRIVVRSEGELKGASENVELAVESPAENVETGTEPQLGAGKPKPKPRVKSEYWIYVNKPQFIDPPTKDYPIVQSYVDVFLSGCLEAQEKFKVKDFAKDCVESTKGWNEHWLNDRVYPRRPFVYQPMSGKIDAILQEKLPVEFEKIQIEG